MIAAALHVALVVALRSRRATFEPGAKAPVPIELEILVDDTPRAIAPSPAPPDREVAVAGAIEPRRAPSGPSGPTAPESIGSSAAVAPPPAPEGAASAAPSDDREARARAAVAGLFGGKLAPGPMAPAAPESSVAPPAPSISKDRAGEVVRDLLDARDREIGVGFGGPVATAAHGAALGGTSPQTGNATIEALTDAGGVVTSVRVLSGVPSAESWAAVASATFAALRGRPLRVGGRSASVVVRLDAKMQLPSGASGALKRKGAGAEFDLSDIGAVQLRVVAARVVSERRL